MSQEIISVENIYIAGNRGPCGGVNMAFGAVEQALDIVEGREPIYTNWSIVNNRPLMDKLAQRGLVNIKNDWTVVPEGSLVFFSAHGVPPSFRRIADEKNYLVIDVTCQLVNRVHSLAKNAERDGKHVVYIGVDGHPETMGVLGELKEESKTLVQTLQDADYLQLPSDREAVVYSQTTLSTNEIKDIMQRLRDRFPDINIPPRWDICYATDNRQAAVDALIKDRNIESLLVVGSPESHNSQELRKKGTNAGIPSYSVDYPDEIQPEWYKGIRNVGLTSGASVMERYANQVINWFVEHNPQVVINFEPQVKEEANMTFKLPMEAITALQARYR